jgi:type I restriction enzyme, S subunit
MSAQELITKHLDIWTTAHKTRSTAGRGSNNKLDLVGIKKLRELILELAVRGKLVAQDPNDVPVSDLLKKIAAEKANLIKEGKIKKEKSLPPISEDEKHFEIPVGWEFIRLGELTSKLGSGSTPRGGQAAYQETGIIFLRSQNVWNDGLKLDDTAYISDETHRAMEGTHVFPNDILLNITGASLGRTTIFPSELKMANVSQHVTIIRLIEPLMVKFVHLGIMSPIVQRLVWGRQVGMAIEGLSKKVLEQFEFPVPPLAEQHRIVAKVDELMAFCDQLEQTLSDNIAAHAQLVEALLATLTNSSDHNELQNNWQRIAAHFDTLFTTEHSIDQLKQTILQLAVMGKLVPQNPNDEPASELLKKIAAEKTQLIKDGKIKKEKPLPEITDEEKPFELPSGWEWDRFPNISFFQEGPGIMAKDFRDSGIPLIRISGMHDNLVSLEGCNFLDKEMVKNKWNHFRLNEGDIVLSSSASLGKVAKVSREAVGSIVYTGLIRFKPYVGIAEEYLIKFLSSTEFQRQINNNKTGAAIMHFGPTHLRLMSVPIPPLAEQHRIVAKVDELLSLCDTLKTNLQNAQTTQLALADALVEQALN